MPTAILVDGSYFIHRHRVIFGSMPPDDVAKSLQTICHSHLKVRRKRTAPDAVARRRRLYRIFYYDCPPLTKKAHNPISGKAIDFSKSDIARWRLEFFEALRRLRKVALRLGELHERGAWRIHPGPLSKLLNKKICFSDLTEHDVTYDVSQKGVDMRLGLDIASLAYKRQVDQIVLIAGDSDFVPAAKLARREGIDFILDPMWGPIRPDLNEHIDGLQSVTRKPQDDAAATRAE